MFGATHLVLQRVPMCYNVFKIFISTHYYVGIDMMQTKLKCNMIHEDLSTTIDEIQFEEARLIHEHYFAPVRLKGLNRFAICCITCGDYYCKICGKLIKHS